MQSQDNSSGQIIIVIIIFTNAWFPTTMNIRSQQSTSKVHIYCKHKCHSCRCLNCCTINQVLFEMSFSVYPEHSAFSRHCGTCYVLCCVKVLLRMLRNAGYHAFLSVIWKQELCTGMYMILHCIPGQN